MRKLVNKMFALVGLATVVMGCNHLHGVCDCDYIDPCYTRAPWASNAQHHVVPVMYNGSTAPPPETLPTPMPKGEAKGSSDGMEE